jgi:esterase FrsA
VSYTYDLRPEASFEDRYSQFLAFGIPKADVDTLRATIKDMWADAPGGRSYEWSAFARKYLEAGNPLLASFANGFAIFPCLANDARRKAQQNQLDCYLKAAPSFPVKFERTILAMPYQVGAVSTPVHLFSVTGQYASAPVLIYTGGVDTYKMGLHSIYVALAQRLGLTILGFDIPGTGESTIPLSVKGDELVLGIVNEARKLGNGKVAHLGFSFGGNFSAMTGLSSAVDAAIVLGGPVDKAWGEENAQNLPFGMAGIIGNDMGFDKEPSLPEFMAAVQQFSRRPLLDQTTNAPMLVINGANAYFVPQADTLVFKGRPKTDVHLLPDIGHCAVLGGVSKLPEVIDIVTQWLPKQIGLDARPQATNR